MRTQDLDVRHLCLSRKSGRARRSPYIVLALVTALAVTAAVWAFPASAGASPSIRYGIQDDAYFSATPSLETRLGTLDRLGTKLVRHMLSWRDIAPTQPQHPALPSDPAYRWTDTDRVLGALHAHGTTVLVAFYRVPSWANGGKGSSVVPSDKHALADFAVAVARRYPWLRLWEVWNEPNLRTFLSPNSPRLYVERMLNPTYRALHALSSSNRVAGGATAPLSTTSGLSPVTFMRGMRKAHAQLDAYSHHAYPVTRGEGPFGFAHGVCRYCTGVLTLANLPALVREVQRDFGPKRIWLTESGWQTNPPDRAGVSPALQARYVAESALRARNAPLVDILIHFLVKDESRTNGWQSGLMWASGVAKPSFNAFMLPIAEDGRRGRRMTIWGQVRPGTGRRRYLLQSFTQGNWAAVGRAALTDNSGSYRRVVYAIRGMRYRIEWLPSNAVSQPLVVR
jgi:hypothetical protein